MKPDEILKLCHDLEPSNQEANSRPWAEFKDAHRGDGAELHLYEEIGMFGTLASDFRDDLKAVQGKDLTVYINSPGGSVFQGYAIANLLARHDGEVTTVVDGLAASISSYIFMQGTKRVIANNGMVMIHRPSGAAAGHAEDMVRVAEVLDKMEEEIIRTYDKNTALTLEEITSHLAKETWYSAQEALDAGYATESAEPIEIAASLDLSSFENVPDHATQLVNQWRTNKEKPHLKEATAQLTDTQKRIQAMKKKFNA